MEILLIPGGVLTASVTAPRVGLGLSPVMVVFHPPAPDPEVGDQAGDAARMAGCHPLGYEAGPSTCPGPMVYSRFFGSVLTCAATILPT
jgi:hypothetical protein